MCLGGGVCRVAGVGLHLGGEQRLEEVDLLRHVLARRLALLAGGRRRWFAMVGVPTGLVGRRVGSGSKLYLELSRRSKGRGFLRIETNGHD